MSTVRHILFGTRKDRQSPGQFVILEQFVIDVMCCVWNLIVNEICQLQQDFEAIAATIKNKRQFWKIAVIAKQMGHPHRTGSGITGCVSHYLTKNKGSERSIFFKFYFKENYVAHLRWTGRTSPTDVPNPNKEQTRYIIGNAS